MTVRVLLADDERLIRAGFRMILNAERDIEVVGEAADGYEAVAAARRLRPDVVLMDIRMPGLNGIDATTRLLEDDAGPVSSSSRRLTPTNTCLPHCGPEQAGSCSRTRRRISSSRPSTPSPTAGRCWRHPSPGACSTTTRATRPRPHRPVSSPSSPHARPTCSASSLAAFQTPRSPVTSGGLFCDSFAPPG
jgi:hypothetical protein